MHASPLPHEDLENSLVKGLGRVRNGADPNASVKKLCGTSGLWAAADPVRDESFLSVLVQAGEKDMVQELLDLGATVDIRSNQPINLIVVALRSIERHSIECLLSPPVHDGMWQSLGIPDFTPPVLEMIELIAAQGVRCAPPDLDQSKAMLVHLGLDINLADPWVVMSDYQPMMNSQMIENLACALIDLGADPTLWIQELLEHGEKNKQLALRVQAYDDHHQLTSSLDTRTIPVPPPLKM